MKKLQLKINDLKNPVILTHHEIKSIMGGSLGGSHTCACDLGIFGSGGYTINHPVPSASTLSDCEMACNQACAETQDCQTVYAQWIYNYE
jgi:hypothetical protein